MSVRNVVLLRQRKMIMIVMWNQLMVKVFPVHTVIKYLGTKEI